MTKERSILFSAPMVRAIIEDRKTQTRRVVKPQPYEDAFNQGQYTSIKLDCHGEETAGPEVFGIYCEDWGIKCPYGFAGDLLWVRETWQQSRLIRSGERQAVRNPAPGLGDIHYAADHYAGRDGDEPPTYRPSIHMPRWASRIMLEILNVRCERLHDITGDDCLAEGMALSGLGSDLELKREFSRLWNVISGDGAWESNPFVWVIEFRRLT